MACSDLLLDACNLWQRFLLALHLQDGGLARAKSSNETNSDGQAGALSVTEVKLRYS